MISCSGVRSFTRLKQMFRSIRCGSSFSGERSVTLFLKISRYSSFFSEAMGVISSTALQATISTRRFGRSYRKLRSVTLLWPISSAIRFQQYFSTEKSSLVCLLLALLCSVDQEV